MKCQKCGSKNRDDDLYCVQCGAELKVIGKDDSVVFACPYCDAENPEAATECQSCHRPVNSPFVYCSACGRRNLASDRFCRECDTPLPVKEVPAPQPETPAVRESILCPSCSRPMEAGFLIAPNEGYFRGIRWSTSEALFWPYAGEPLQRGNLFVSNLNMPALRCESCRIVVLSY
jgi:ribosomal protein L40E